MAIATPQRDELLATPGSSEREPASKPSPYTITGMQPPTALNPVKPAPTPSYPTIPQVAPAQPQPQAQVAGGNPEYSGFGPGNNLIGTQINPYGQYQFRGQALSNLEGAQIGAKKQIAATDVSQAKRLLEEAEGNVGQANIGADYGSVGAGSYAPGADAQAARAALMQVLASLSNGPDREAMAAEQLRLLEEQTNPGFETALRTANQRAAAMGHRGSGLVNQNLGEVVSSREQLLDQARRGVALETADKRLSDRYTQAAGVGSISGQINSEDLATSDQQLKMRNEARAERDAKLNEDLQRAMLALQRSGALGSLAGGQLDVARTVRQDGESDRNYDLNYDSTAAQLAIQRAGMYSNLDQMDFGNELAMRNEMRGERQYQSSQAQQAWENQFRDLELATRLGFQGNPTGTILAASGQGGADSGPADLLAQYAMRQAAERQAAGVASTPTIGGK